METSPHAPEDPAATRRVLVVDDDPTVAEVVTGYLLRAGYEVDRAEDGPVALDRAAARWPDLVVLDLMLPGIDGLEVCRRLRARGPVPVIMLTARGDEDDRILGLEIGADDYVTKPFSPRELVLRVDSVLRRTRAAGAAATAATAGRPGSGVLRAAGLTADPASRRATKNGTELALTVREFDLLTFFLRHPGRVFGREELMREVWGWEFGDLSTVTVHVRRLRGKVEDDPARPTLIQTVWGVGYRLDVPESDVVESDVGESGVRESDLGQSGVREPGVRESHIRPSGAPESDAAAFGLPESDDVPMPDERPQP
ncbi:response regulator transcription factor [Streptomyces sp. NPDC002851]